MSEHGNNAAMHETLETLRTRFDNDVMAYQDRYLRFSDRHWHKKAEEAAMWRDVFHELREVCDAALAAPPEPTSNTAAIREALESTEELLEHFAKPGTMLGDAFALHMRDNRDALSDPPRNCDILSEEEANEAWEEYRHCHTLPLGGWDFRHVIALLYAKATKKG